jgi:hypothetical protein
MQKFSNKQELIEPGVQRTQFQCFRRSTSQNPGAFYDLGAVSYTRRSTPGAMALPLFTGTPQPVSLDQYAYDITELCRPAPNRPCKIDQMYVFGCLSAAYSDMATAQGCFGDHDNAAHDMLYCGFTKEVTQNNAKWLFLPGLRELLTHVVQGLVVFFNELGDEKTVPQAVSVIESQGTDIRQALFGADGDFNNTHGLLDRSDEDDDIMTFYGYGYIGNVKLE